MKPVIGVIPLWNDKKDSLWMLPGYLEGIKIAGGIPFIFPFLQEKADIFQLMERCDGCRFIIITGRHS